MKSNILKEENTVIYYSQIFRLKSLPIAETLEGQNEGPDFFPKIDLINDFKELDQKNTNGRSAPTFREPMTMYGKKYRLIKQNRFNRKGVSVIQSTDINKMEIQRDSYFQFQPVGYTFGYSVDRDASNRRLLFCQELRIKHVNSGQYLTIEEHQYTEGRFKIMLKNQKQPTSNSIFLVKPTRSFEKAAGDVKHSSSVDIYCPKFDTYIYPQKVNDEYVVLAGNSRQYKWKMYDFKNKTQQQSNIISNYDIVFIVSKILDGKLSFRVDSQGKYQLRITDSSMSSDQIPQPKLFSCLWWVSNFLDNKKKHEHLHPQASLGQYQSFHIVDTLVSYALEIGQFKAPEITFTHFITQKVMTTKKTFIRYSPTDDTYQNPLELVSGDYIKIKTGRLNNEQWLVEEGDKAIFRSSLQQDIKESFGSPFRIYKLNSEMTKFAYLFTQAKAKLQDCLKQIFEYKTVIQYSFVVPRQFLFMLNEQIIYLLQFLQQELSSNTDRLMMLQTMIYDVGLLQIILKFIKKIYEIFADHDQNFKLKEYSAQFDNLFIFMHRIFRLCCKNNNYIKEKILQQGAWELVELVIKRDCQERLNVFEYELIQYTSDRLEIYKTAQEKQQQSLNQNQPQNVDEIDYTQTPGEMQTLKQLLSKNKYATENVIKPIEIQNLISTYVGLQYTLAREQRFLLILRLLCRSGNEILKLNQQAIIKNYFQKNGSSDKIRKVQFKISQDNRIMIYKGISLNQEKQKIFQNLYDWYRSIEDDEQFKQEIIYKNSLRNEIKKSFSQNHHRPRSRQMDSDLKKIRVQQWKVFEIWLELLGDVSDGRNLQGQWLIGTIFSRHCIQAFLEVRGGSINKSFLRIFNNYLIENSFNSRTHFNLVWLAKKSFTDEKIKITRDKKNQKANLGLLRQLKQYISFYLKTFNRPISRRYLLQGVQMLKIFRNMLEFGLWHREEGCDQKEKSIKQLVNILNFLDQSRSKFKVSSYLKQDVSEFKIYTLQSIKYYLNTGARERFQQYVKNIFQDIAQDVDLVGDQKKNQAVDPEKSHPLQESKIQIALKYISEEYVVKLDNQIQYIIMDSNSNSQLYSIALETRNFIMQVQRNAIMMLRFAVIVEPSDKYLGLFDLLNEARQIFEVTLTPAMKQIDLDQQFKLLIPIWSAKEPCLMKKMFKITRLMKSNDLEQSDPDDVNIYKSFPQDQDGSVTQPFTELQKPQDTAQKMVLESGIIKLLMKFLESFDYTNNNKLYIKLIQAAYYLLSVYFWKYSRAKKHFFIKWRLFLAHAQFSLGALMALRQYCRGSYWLQHSHQKVNQIVQRVCKYIVRELRAKNYIKAAVLLDFFSVLIKYNQHNLNKNKMIILINIFSKDIQRIKTSLIQIRNKQNQCNPTDFKQHKKSASHGISPRSYLSQQKNLKNQIIFTITLYRLLGQLSDNHHQNTVRCKKLHSFEEILSSLTSLTYQSQLDRPNQQVLSDENQENWSLKFSLRNYLNVLYYSHLEERYTQKIINEDLKNIIGQINEYIRTKIASPDLSKITFKYKIRESYVLTIIQKQFISVLDTLDILLSQNQQFNQDSPKHQNLLDKNSSQLSLQIQQDNTGNSKSRKQNKFLVETLLMLQQSQKKQFNVQVFKLFFQIFQRINYISNKVASESYVQKGFPKEKLFLIIEKMKEKIFQVNLKNKTNFCHKQIMEELFLQQQKKYCSLPIKLKQNFFQTDNQGKKIRKSPQNAIEALFKVSGIQQFFSCSNSTYKKIISTELILSMYDLNNPLDQLKEGDRKIIHPKKSTISRVSQLAGKIQNSQPKQNKKKQGIEIGHLSQKRSPQEQYLKNIYKIFIYNKLKGCQKIKKAAIYSPIAKQMIRLADSPLIGALQKSDNNSNEFIANLKRLNTVIDKFIFQQGHQISEDMVQFYFRLMTKYLDFKEKKSPNDPENNTSNKIKKGQNQIIKIKKFGEYIQQALNKTICRQIYKTIVKGGLQDHLLISHELFFFCGKYFKINSDTNPVPQPLMNIIQQEDSKNLFINNIKQLITYYIDDVVRNDHLSKKKQKEQHEKDILQKTTKINKQENSEGRNKNNLEKDINRKSIRECSKSIYLFLQLLCQNNYVPFKKYFRQQKNMDNSLKPNNHNLLILSTYNLRKVFKVFSNQTNDQPFKIINFLNQIAQIPCNQNLLQLAKSTFFQDVCEFILVQWTQSYKLIQTNQKPIKDKKTCKEISIIIITFLKMCVSMLQSNNIQISELFSLKINSEFMKEVCTIYRFFLNQGLKDEIKQDKQIQEYWIRKIKAIIIIIYKLLLNHPKQTVRMVSKIKILFHTQLRNIEKQIIESKKKTEVVNSSKVSHDQENNQIFCFIGIEVSKQFITKLKYSLNKFKSLHQQLQFLFSSIKQIVQQKVKLLLNMISRQGIDQEDSEQETQRYRREISKPLKQQQEQELVGLQMLDPREYLTKEHFNYMLDTVLSVEVFIEGSFHTLYFFKPEIALDIKEQEDEELQRILYSLNRGSQKVKLQSLVDSLPKLQTYMRYRFYVKETHYAFGDLTHFFYKSAMCISILINIILCFVTSIEITTQKSASYFPSILGILKVIQLLFGSFYCYSIIANAIKKSELQKKINFKKKHSNQENDLDKDRLSTSFEIKKLSKQDYFIDLSYKELWQILVDNIASILFMVICIMGFLVSPYYYAVHMFYLLARNKVLDSIFQAFARNIFLLGGLALASTFIFITFSIMSAAMYAELAEDACHTIYQCFIVVYNRDVYLDKTKMNDADLNRIIFTLVYTVFFGELLQSIISNIFSGDFAQRRDQIALVQKDENNFCYICGRDRHSIQSDKNQNPLKLKLSQVFTRHKKLHNKWNYLYYIYELREKLSTDYTGIEYIIDKKCKQGDVSWFPVQDKKDSKLQELKILVQKMI